MTPYDFTAPPRLARDQTRLFEVSLETFARQWSTQLSSRLQALSSVVFVGLEQKTYDQFAGDLKAPTMMLILSADNFGTGVLAMPVQCALDHMEHTLGGKGGDQPERTLTDIEVSITLSMCEKALATTKYAFASFLPEEIMVDAIKQDPQLLQAGRASDIVVIASFTMNLGEANYPISLMLPLGPLQERLVAATSPEETVSAEEQRRALQAAQAIRQAVPAIPVDVSLRLTPIRVSPQAVLDLQVGDLIEFNHQRSHPLEVATSDQIVAHGVPTTTGRHRACLIISVEENPSE